MIWGYVLANCRPRIEMERPVHLHRSQSYFVASSDDEKGWYSPHPLCFICKKFSAEVSDQMFQTALFTVNIDPKYFKPQTFSRVTRLRLDISLVHGPAIHIISFLESIADQPTTNPLTAANTAGLRYLELEWRLSHFDTFAWFSRTVTRRNFLTRMVVYNNSLDLRFRFLFGNHKTGAVACVAIVNAKSLKFECYDRHFGGHQGLERLVADIITYGCSNVGRQEIEGPVCCAEHTQRYTFLSGLHL